MSARELITEHLDLWTGAVRNKFSSGRGSNSKVELTGVKKLRELIFELASRGALIPKVNDTARILKLQEFAELVMGQAPPGSECNKNGIGEIFVKTGEFGAIYPEVKEWTTKPLRMARQGDVLICVVGATVGKLNMAIDCAIGRSVAAIRPDETIISEYLYYCLIPFTLKIRSQSKGSAQGVIGKAVLNNVELRVPPLDEQKLIVQKVDELMALCDRLEQQTSDQLEAHETLVDTLLGTLTQSENAAELADNWARLAAHFDTLFTTEQSIDKLKQTILQLAVMGRLVEQDAGDEPAESLLNRLRENRQAWLQEQSSSNPECKTMLRKLGKLRPAQSPIPLPKGWCPAHLIQLCRMLVDCHNKTAPYVEEGIPIIRTSNIRERRFNFKEIKYVDEDTYTYWSRRCPPEPEDIIFTREAPMGEAAIIPEGKTWCLGQRTMLIRPMHEYISNKFLLLTLTEPHLLERAAEKAIGSTVKHLRVGDVENLVVPVPPLEEQHRIVQKVDDLMALCDQLKERLNQAGETRNQLAEAAVEGALS